MDYFKDFDEAAYLSSNPDVYQALQNGLVSSGWSHFICNGIGENRPGVPPETFAALKNILELGSKEPVPPQNLRRRVHGEADLDSFENVGRVVAFEIHRAINPVCEISAQSRILDFGCGCGRVIRYFHKLWNNSGFHGTDIDGEAIAWCQDHLSHLGTFSTNAITPPLPYNAETFDVVYCVSVFTHLPEKMQFEWLKELQRVTKPGAYLLLTTHGPEALPARLIDRKNQLQKTGFYHHVEGRTAGLPDFYQTTFHTEDYIRQEWGKFFTVHKFSRKGIANFQDLILCQKI